MIVNSSRHDIPGAGLFQGNIAPLLTPRLISDASTVMTWAQNYICQPHPDLGRDGAICPFVQPSIERNYFYLTMRYEVDGMDPLCIRQILLDNSELFFDCPPFEEPENIYKAIIVCFPNISDDCAPVLDTIHAQIKDVFVGKGLMVGQFYKDCPEPAARNPFFKVSISPIPLVAMRHMSIHDILFLNTRREWFMEYDKRFGNKYAECKVSSAAYRDAYQEARSRFICTS